MTSKSSMLLQTAAGSLLEAERKTESSLKRLNRSRAAEGASDVPAVSNTDKMMAQLFLDAQVMPCDHARFCFTSHISLL